MSATQPHRTTFFRHHCHHVVLSSCLRFREKEAVEAVEAMVIYAQPMGLKDFSVLFYLFFLPKVCELNSLLLSPDESYIILILDH